MSSAPLSERDRASPNGALLTHRPEHDLGRLHQDRRLERVEVVRGPATLLYGSGAAGGLINIVDTRLPADGGRTVPYERFLLDQDTGGAMRSAGRCDVYMGVGPDALLLAGRQPITENGLKPKHGYFCQGPPMIPTFFFPRFLPYLPDPP